MKRFFIISFMIIIGFVLVGCDKNNDNKNYKWKNYEAIYVTINDKYSNIVFQNIDKNFETYQYKKSYVVNKEIYDNYVYKLEILFVIGNNIDEFITNLKNDERVSSYEICKDLPYESIDNRYFEYENSNIKVGDKLKITLSGNSDIYLQKFLYDSFFVIPANYDESKEYDKSFFPEIDNVLYVKNINGKLLVALNNSDYYELITTMDALAKTEYIQLVDFNYIEVIHPIWEFSNKEIIDVVVNDDNSITISALKSGIVNIKYDGIECEITISDK